MTLEPQVIAGVEAFVVPELAVEFTDTLCRAWAEQRHELRAGGDPTIVFKLLDSLAGVVIEDFEVYAW